MAYIIIGLMICVFSIGMLTSSPPSYWGIAGLALGGFLIIKGRGNFNSDD